MRLCAGQIDPLTTSRRSILKHTLSALLVTSLIVASTAPAHAVTSAELIRNQAYVYGRFEARIRFAPGDGVVSSFFLWKTGSEVSGTYWNELDFEKLGADCHLQTNALYGSPVTDTSKTNPVNGDICGEYHTYAFEWTPDAIAWLVDGVELRREGGEIAAAFTDNAKAGMQIHFNIWPGDATFGGTLDPSTLPLRQYISWVQYSSYADGVFTEKWREDFNATTLPSGWSTGNWTSPKGNSKHSAANVTFSSGISVLSLTADDSTGFAGTPPVDDSAGGSPGTGGTSGAGGSTASGTNAAGSPATGGAVAAESTAAAANPPDDTGCGCRTLSTGHAAQGAAWLMMAVGVLAGCRRRTRVNREP
jgi:hypothetical protein